MASQSRVSSSGPFTFRAPVATARGWRRSIPSCVQLVLRFRRSPASALQRLTCPRQHPLRVRLSIPVSGQLSTGSHLEGWPHRQRFPVAFRPPAFASWASCSRPTDLGLPHGRLTPPNSGGDPAGFPRSARTRISRGGCPLYPGTVVLSRLDALHQPAPAAFSGSQSCTPLKHPTWRGSR